MLPDKTMKVKTNTDGNNYIEIMGNEGFLWKSWILGFILDSRGLQNQNKAKNRKSPHWMSSKQPKKQENTKNTKVRYFFRFFRDQNFLRHIEFFQYLVMNIQNVLFMRENVLRDTKYFQKYF